MSVQIDAHVVVQVNSHLCSAFPAPAGGILLGTGPHERQQESTLRVTESFALPQQLVESGSVNPNSKDASEYMKSMIHKLGLVGSDKYVEGWYISSSVGGIYDSQVFENMYAFQKENPTSFLLVNDIALNKSTRTLGLRAFRLSSNFMSLRNNSKKRISTEQLLEHEVDFTNLLEELHVSVINSTLIQSFASSYLASHPKESTVSGALGVPGQDLLEVRGEAVMDTIDDLNYEQGNYNFYQRQLSREKAKLAAWQQKRQTENAQRAERGEPALPVDEWKKLFNLMEEPSRLENLLLSAQLDEHCDQLDELVGTTCATILPTKFVS